MADNVNRLVTRDGVANRALDNIRDVVNPLLRRTSSLETSVSGLNATAGSLDSRVVDLENGEQNGDATWDDIQGPSLMAGGVSSLVIEQYGDVTGMTMPFFSHNLDRTVSFPFQLPHRWNKGEVHCHAHIVPMADPAANEVVKLSGKYAWAKYGVQVPENASWTTFDVAHTVAPGDLRKPTIVSLFSSTPTSPKESDFLLVVLSRLGLADATDTYTTSKPGAGTAAANVCLLGCDTHFQVEKTGTATEIPT